MSSSPTAPTICESTDRAHAALPSDMVHNTGTCSLEHWRTAQCKCKLPTFHSAELNTELRTSKLKTEDEDNPWLSTYP